MEQTKSPTTQGARAKRFGVRRSSAAFTAGQTLLLSTTVSLLQKRTAAQCLRRHRSSCSSRSGKIAGCCAIRTPPQSARGLFPLPINRKPSPEAGAALIICHPELAKDLTPHRQALCNHLPFSKLTAPHDEPSVPITYRLKRTSRSPRGIPSTDSGQALRRLPMNLPVARGRSAPTARPYTSLGQRPIGIKLRKSALVPNLQIGNAIVCESPIRAALKEGSALRPAKDSVPGNPSLDRVRRWVVDGSRIRDSKTSAFPIRDWERERERACVSKGPRLNIMAVGQRPRLHCGRAGGAEK